MIFKKLIVLLLFFCLLACEKKPESDLVLQKVPFPALTSWNEDNFADFSAAFNYSCTKILWLDTPLLSSAKIEVNTKDYQQICHNFINSDFASAKEIKAFIEQNFVPYKIVYKNSDEGLFTSYYESAIKVSTQKDDVYKYPIYGKPDDLIEFNIADFDENLPAKRYVGRLENGRVIPYFSRKEIEEKTLNAPIVFWTDSLIDLFIMQIQGSAVATLPDGQKVRIGYADNNGLNFKGIGSVLLEKGVLQKGKSSMADIKTWLQNNPALARQYMQENPRYIFHKIINADGPIGAQGVPLTAGRSLAVDASFIPLGSVLWLQTYAPNNVQINKLMVAQDIGGAIKGAVRGDYFWGSGSDDVLKLAGSMKSAGKYFILLPKK